MFKLSMCRICLVENVQMHCIIGTNLHEVYEKLTEISFETKDCRPLQVCYICQERLKHCYKLQARCHKSEEVLTHILNNGPKPTPLQDIHMLKISKPLIHVDIAPAQSSLCDDGKIDDNHLKAECVQLLDYKQVKEEHFKDEDNQNIEDNNTEIDSFGMEIKEEFVPEVEHISSNPIVSESDHIKVFFSETSSNEIQSERKHIIKEVENMKPSVPVSKKSIQCARTYTREKPYQCSICDKCFRQKQYLVAHMRTHACEQPYKCDICENAFAQNSTLKAHRAIHTVDNLPNDEVQTVLKRHNIGNSHKVGNHTSTEMYMCNICDKTFNQMNFLIDHIRIHTGKKPHQCSYCQKSFIRKQQLIAHTRKHTGEKPYKCDICEKAFAHNCSLKAHRAIHIVDNLPNDEVQTVLKRDDIGNSHKVGNHTCTKVYYCNICDKSFNQINFLNDHIRIHTGEKPYQCSYCQKSFRQKIHLIAHTRTHTGEKPYKCDICEKSYAQKKGLKYHQGINADKKTHV